MKDSRAAINSNQQYARPQAHLSELQDMCPHGMCQNVDTWHCQSGGLEATRGFSSRTTVDMVSTPNDPEHNGRTTGIAEGLEGKEDRVHFNSGGMGCQNWGLEIAPSPKEKKMVGVYMCMYMVFPRKIGAHAIQISDPQCKF